MPRLKRDSSYELLFDEWLKVAKREKFVKSSRYKPRTYTLTKPEYSKELVYTPDYEIEVCSEFFKQFPKAKKFLSEGVNILDIKSKYDGLKTGSNREFPFKKYLMWLEYCIDVKKITLDLKVNLFSCSFYPKEMALDKRFSDGRIKKSCKGYLLL